MILNKKAISILLVSVLLVSSVPSASAASYTATTNRNAQDYEYYWASAVNSYIYEASGIVRVERLPSGRILVDTYNYDYELESSRTIEPELPLWGGFYAGEKYNFFIFGQANSDEDASAEVIRVVKYSKNWKRRGAASIYGENIAEPFYAGSLRCAECDGVLCVSTCRQEYTSADGGNRQSNFVFRVDEDSMRIDYTSASADSPETGYVTHSFDQYTAVGSNGDIVCLDLGDESPRAIVATRYVAGTGDDDDSETTAAGYTGEVVSVNIQAISGDEGDNETGAQLGGLAAISDGYVAVYSMDSDIYLAHIASGFTSSKDVRITRLTKGRTSSGTPVLASKGDEGGWVLWTNGSGEVQYIPYGADGSTGTAVTDTKGAMLSDCQPTAYGDGVIWYVTDGTAPIFFTLDSSGITRHYYAGGWADRDVTDAINAGLVPADIQSDYTESITRRDFCRIMVALLEQKSGKTAAQLAASKNLTITNPFTDTSDSSVAAAYTFGIVNGVGNAKFAPNSGITRQEAAVMLERTAKLLGLSGGAGLSFSDINDCAEWAKTQIVNISGYVESVTGARVMNGVSEGVFSPLGSFTKQQAIVTALRLYRCD